MLQLAPITLLFYINQANYLNNLAIYTKIVTHYERLIDMKQNEIYKIKINRL